MNREGPEVTYCVWQPHKAWFETTPEGVLKRVKWPSKTETGDRLREWLKEVDLPKVKPADLDMKKIEETGWGPEAHQDDPVAQTKMVV